MRIKSPQRQEQAFVFVNLENGAAVAYEAYGQYLGKGAASNKPGIPEEAYQVDYLITPDLREAAGVSSGLAEKGAKIKAVLRLPGEGNPLDDDVNPLTTLDRAFGIEDTAEDFQAFLEKESSLAKTNLIMLQTDENIDLSPSAWGAKQMHLLCPTIKSLALAQSFRKKNVWAARFTRHPVCWTKLNVESVGGVHDGYTL